MADQVALFDTRAVKGRFIWAGTPVAAQVVVRPSTPTAEYLDEILSLSGGGEISVLYICCHGISMWHGGIRTPEIRIGGTVLVESRRPFGVGRGLAYLQLGSEHLTAKRLDDWSALRGVVRRIELLACQAADTHPTIPQADGLKFCGKLARVTGATVRASPSTQLSEIEDEGEQFTNPWPMEGPIYVFDPASGSYRKET